MKVSVIILVSVIISVTISSIIVFSLLQTISHKDNDNLVIYDIQSKLKVVYQNNTINFIDLDLNLAIIGKHLSEYNFSKNNLVLSNGSPDYKFVYIYFYIPEAIFKSYDNYVGFWQVESHKSKIRQDNFSPIGDGVPFLFANEDITNLFWMEDPPDEIKTSVQLTN